MGQNSTLDYGKAIQYQLKDTVDPVPVYAAFNRNWATQSDFIVWYLRNVHQPVYTGQIQNNKGIDTPTVQISVFSTTIENSFTIAQNVVNALHGYSGQFGGEDGFYVTKIDVYWLHNTYDNETKMAQVVLDATLYIQT